ncbi:MAG: tyrosine-type recombinase/integrase [Burkholderiales bacterium]|nr:tyrosine-type recombinase/integrase [Burkholderiales bacterium]MBK8666742.1 tyrosine-type recombinase/integrase [Burkholderiales bacterium]
MSYLYQRGEVWYFQRAVPGDLLGRYPGKNIKRSLKTRDPIKAARLAASLNERYDAEFDGLRQSPDTSPASLKVHIREFLRGYGLAPHAVPEGKADPDALELLEEILDAKRPSYAVRPGDEAREPSPADYLSPLELAARQALYSPKRDTLSDLRDVYVTTHRKRNRLAFTQYTDTVFDSLIAAVGDKPVDAFTREDAHAYVAARLERGNKTGTARRRIQALKAAWNAYRVERTSSLPNVWERLSIADEGADAKPRIPFTDDELARLYAACRAADDDRRWLLAMLIDTGARLAEISGLALSDIHLDVPIPYISIQPNEIRGVKDQDNAARRGPQAVPHSIRNVPLVGAALWGAQRVVETAPAGRVHAFPRYAREGVRNGDNASGALNAWMRAPGRGFTGKTVHELRHTMKDRLRNVQCQQPIYDAIQGHAPQNVGGKYGLSYNLAVRLEWLLKVALPGPGGEQC